MLILKRIKELNPMIQFTLTLVTVLTKSGCSIGSRIKFDLIIILITFHNELWMLESEILSDCVSENEGNVSYCFSPALRVEVIYFST